MSIADPLKQKIRHEQIAKRIKETKELEREYSKGICQMKRDYEAQKEKQAEYIEVIEQYKNLLKEIEELKQSKIDIIAAKEKAELDREKERVLLEKYNEELRQKKIQFDQFMKQKGREAFEYLFKMNQTKQTLDEELHRYQRKKETKEMSYENSKQIVDNYRQKEYEERMKYRYEEPDSTSNVLYKVAAPYHNNGNKIDYSTTNFHNVVVTKHKDPNDPYLNVNAFNKAQEESEKNIQRRKEKEQKIKNFNKQMEQNYKEQIRQNKAKENLERLNEEMKKLQLAKKKNNSKSNKINLNQNLNNANSLNKKSDFLVNKLLSQQGGNLKNIINCKEANLVDPNEISNADETSLNEFYKDDSEDNEKDDGILYKKLPDDDEKEKVAVKNYQFFYAEPIERDPKPIKQKISRVSPVDLPSYQKSIYENPNNIVHVEPKTTIVDQIKSTMRAETMMSNSSINESSTFSVLDILNLSKPKVSAPQNQQAQKRNIAVSKFSSLSSKNSPGFNMLNIQAEIEKSEKKDKEIEKRKEEFAIGFQKQIKDQINTDSKPEIKEETNSPVPNTKGTISVFGGSGKKSLKKLDIAPIMENPNEEEENETKSKKNESKDSKWRMNKQELLERRKKMIKDKSNLNKDKNKEPA